MDYRLIIMIYFALFIDAEKTHFFKTQHDNLTIIVLSTVGVSLNPWYSDIALNNSLVHFSMIHDIYWGVCAELNKGCKSFYIFVCQSQVFSKTNITY